MNYHIERFCRRIGSILLLICAVVLLMRSHREMNPKQNYKRNHMQDRESYSEQKREWFSVQDYEEYLRKIWVIQDWDGVKSDGDYGDRMSFRITEIDQNTIRGKIAFGTLAEPYLYTYSSDSTEKDGDFTGVILFNKAYCEFSDAAGNKGVFIITFQGDDAVEATVHYTEKAVLTYLESIEDETWAFRPYHMQDILDMEAGKGTYFKTNYMYGPYWQGGRLIYAVITDETTHIDSFITDDMYNIFYHFALDYPENATNCNVEVVYDNRDDLQDIQIQCYDSNERGAECLADYILIQKDDGTFYVKGDNDVILMEDKGQKRKQSITYTLDETQKAALTSGNGEIYVEIPCWKEFSHVYTTKEYGKESLHMSNDIDYDQMEYMLISGWNFIDANEEDLFGLKRHLRGEYQLGELKNISVAGIEVNYRLCYHDTNSKWKKWHYIIRANLGCGQILRADITQGMFGDAAWEKFSGEEMSASELFKPLDIEGLIETLFSNLEVYTADGEPIEMARIDVPSVNKDMLFDTFVFGAVREYAADEYRETASCAGLIEMLYEAVQTGNIQELLSQESIGETELSIAEKLDYIKNEKSGRLAKYDFLHAYAKGDYPTKYYLVEGADDLEDIFVYRLYDFSDEQFYYRWFKCEKDSEGNITAQKGMPMYSSGMNEHYFLSWQGLPYLCIANRNEEGEIESVVLYDFQTPDYIGTLLYINASSIRVCSYIQNEEGYKTENPLYLFDE